MRRLFERLVGAWPLHSRCRRALEETLSDWEYEEERATGFRRWWSDLRSAVSVLRALVLASIWRPASPLNQPYRASGPQNARDEIMNLLNELPPDSSYEDILRELASRRGAKPGADTPTPPSQTNGPAAPALAWWRRAMTRRNLPVAAFCVVVSLAGSVVQIWWTPVRFAAAAIVRAEPEIPTIIATAQTQQMMAPVDADAFMQAELAVLTSRDLARVAVRKLRLDRNPDFAGDLAAVVDPPAPPGDVETQAEQRAINKLNANLAVALQQTSHMFVIRYSASRPDVTALVANTLATEYATRNLYRKRATMTDRLNKLGEFVKNLSAEIQADRTNLISQTARNNVLDPDAVARNVNTAQGDLSSKITALRDRKAKMDELAALDPDKDLEKALKHPDVMRATTQYRSQLQVLTADRLRYANLGAGSEHPMVKAVDGQIDRVRTNIRAEIHNLIESAKQDYEAAKAEEETAQRHYDAQARAQIENVKMGIPYQALKARIESNQNTLDSMQKQQKDLEILARGVDNNVSVIEYVQPPTRPYSPNKTQIVLVWLAGGLLAAAAVIGARLRRGRLPAPAVA